MIGTRIGTKARENGRVDIVIAERFVHKPHFHTVKNHEFEKFNGKVMVLATVDDHGGKTCEILLPGSGWLSEVSFTVYGWRLVNLDYYQYTGNAGRRFPQYVKPGVVTL